MGSQSVNAALAFTTNGGAFDANAKRIPFISSDLSREQATVVREGIRGTRSRYETDDCPGLITNAGTVSWEPAPDELDFILPYILGGAENADNFPVDEALPKFDALVDRVASVDTFTGVYVSRAVFSAQSGQPLTLSLDLIAEASVVGAAGTFPDPTAEGGTGPDFSTQKPYMSYAGVITLGGTAYSWGSFELAIDNFIEQTFNQNQQLDYADPADRVVTFAVNNPYTVTELPIQYAEGIAGSIVFTNGGLSTAFNLASLNQDTHRQPGLSGRQEIRGDWNFNVRRTAALAEISVDNDPVP